MRQLRNYNFWTMLFINFFLLFVFEKRIYAFDRKAPVPVDHCIVRLDNRSVARTPIAVDGTVLDFPIKPSKIILGRKNSFGIEYVESDLAISPLAPSARSHLYVYLEGRRFTFDLSTVMNGGCAIIVVRDSKDNQVSVDGFFRPRK